MLRGVKQQLHVGSDRLQYAQLCVLITAGTVSAAVAIEGMYTCLPSFSPTIALRAN
jgi:hypothetical protein